MKTSLRLLLLGCSLQPFAALAQTYCQPEYVEAGAFGDYIDGFMLGTIDNETSGPTDAPGFANYTYSGTGTFTTLEPGGTYPAIITSGPAPGINSYSIWVDLDHDLIYESYELLAQASTSGPGVQVTTVNVTIPADAALGYTRLRVMSGLQTPPTSPCGFYLLGETEDYTVIIDDGSPCIPAIGQGTTMGDYIDGVQFGAIDNTGSGGTAGEAYTSYVNASIITSVTPGSTYPMTITAGSFDPIDPTAEHYGVWMDLDQDGVFANDELLATGTTTAAGEQLTLSVSIPVYAVPGYTRMRVRSAFALEMIDACQPAGYGETEDYTVVIDDGSPCIPVYTYGTQEGEMITGVVIGTINNVYSGGPVSPGYSNYMNAGPAYLTSLAPGGAYPISISSWNLDLVETYYSVWVDLDQNSAFTSNEMLASNVIYNTPATLNLNVTIPAGTPSGYTRMRVMCTGEPPSSNACGTYTYGETEDYTVVIDDGAPCIPVFAYGASDGHYPSGVELGAINWAGSQPATGWTDATQFGTHLQQGSTNTLTIYGGPAASGYVSAWIDLNGDGFDANDLIGSLPVGAAFAQVSFSVTVPNLFSGYTRLRVAHSNANVVPCGLSDEGSAVDFAIVVDQPGWPCLPLLGHGTRYGDGFTDLTIDGDPYGTQVAYPYVTASFSTPLHNTIGGTMSIGFTAGAYAPETYRLWLDMNNDGDFSDADELLASYSSSFAGEAIGMNVQIPATCPPGQHFLRLRANDDVGFPLSDACEDQLYGQVFDRLIAVEDPDGPCIPYLSSWTLFDDFIDGVQLGGAQNLGTGGTFGAAYHDYPSPAISLLMGSTDTLRITGGAYGGDTYSAWIDYNADNDFADANESLGWVGIADPYGTSELAFTVPPGTTLGIKRMRVRCALDPLSDACADDLYGETEDYRVSIDVNTGLVVMNPADIRLLPTTDGVQLVTDATWIGNDYTVFDATGRAIGSGQISSERTEVPMLAFAHGAYTVLVQHEAKPAVKRFTW